MLNFGGVVSIVDLQGLQPFSNEFKLSPPALDDSNSMRTSWVSVSTRRPFSSKVVSTCRKTKPCQNEAHQQRSHQIYGVKRPWKHLEDHWIFGPWRLIIEMIKMKIDWLFTHCCRVFFFRPSIACCCGAKYFVLETYLPVKSPLQRERRGRMQCPGRRLNVFPVFPENLST